MSRRLSLSGGGHSALRESSSRHNIRVSSTPSRRQSFGGNQLDYQSDGELVKPDRRVMLDKWRREREDTAARMTSEIEPEAAIPASLPSNTSESRSALERFRDRKRKERQHENVLPPTHPSATTRSTICYDDDEDYGHGGGTGTFISSGTPSFSRRLGGTASKARRRSYSVGARGRSMNLSQENESTLLYCIVCYVLFHAHLLTWLDRSFSLSPFSITQTLCH